MTPKEVQAYVRSRLSPHGLLVAVSDHPRPEIHAIKYGLASVALPASVDSACLDALIAELQAQLDEQLPD